MNSIPMTVEGLKDQYEQCCEIESTRRALRNEAVRAWSKASRERKAAYRKWQAKLKEDE